MPATYVESLTNPRDSLPNVYTNVTAREIDFVTRFELGSPAQYPRRDAPDPQGPRHAAGRLYR